MARSLRRMESKTLSGTTNLQQSQRLNSSASIASMSYQWLPRDNWQVSHSLVQLSHPYVRAIGNAFMAPCTGYLRGYRCGSRAPAKSSSCHVEDELLASRGQQEAYNATTNFEENTP
jgi:hypothetical protein